MPARRILRPAAGVAALLSAVLVTLAVGTAHSGSARAAAVKVSPGANLNAVYQAADPGDEILLAAGDYGDQTVSKDRDKPPGSARVVFRAQGVVTMSDFTTRASDVEYVGFRVPNSDFLIRAGHNVVVRNARAHKPYIWGPRPGVDPGDPVDGVTIKGGDFGPHASCGGGFQITSDGPPKNITIDGATFHDFTVPSSCPDAHLDCLHAFNGIHGLTIRNSRFYRCEHFGMLINGGSNITIENNFLSGGIYGFKLRGDNSPSVEVFNDVLIRNNSADEISLGSDDSNTLNNVRVDANATVQRVDCRDGVSYTNNLAQRGSRCRSSNDFRNAGSIGFANLDDGDFHIPARSPAVDRISGGPAADFDGNLRPQGPKSDVGADEVAQPGAPRRPGRGTLLVPILKKVQHLLRVTVQGYLRVRIGCGPASAGPVPKRCRGVGRLFRLSPGSSARRSTSLLGEARFSVRTGHSKLVKVRLRRGARNAVRRHHVRAILSVRVGTGSRVKAARKRVVLARRR